MDVKHLYDPFNLTKGPIKDIDDIDQFNQKDNKDYSSDPFPEEDNQKGANNPIPFDWKYFEIPFYGILYCIASISAVFLNKIILSKNGKYKSFGSVELLMFIQSIIGVFELLFFKYFHIIKFPIIVDYQRFYRIISVNFFFVMMTVANAYTVRFLSIPMVALLKNCQVAVVCFLEFIFLHTFPGKISLVSLGIIIMSSICGSITDLEFNFPGYVAMFIAIFSSALYIVLVKLIFKRYEVSEFTLSFYNNLVSVPCFFFMGMTQSSFFTGIKYTLTAPHVFLLILFISGIAGVGVNITTYLFIGASSATSFSVLGVIKKVTQTLLGYIFWATPTNVSNVFSVIIGIFGGIMYSISKKFERAQYKKNIC